MIARGLFDACHFKGFFFKKKLKNPIEKTMNCNNACSRGGLQAWVEPQ